MSPAPLANDRSAGIVSLCVVLAALAVLWLGILPRIGRQPAVRDYIERNEELGIDTSAKFYTEHPAMGVFMDRIDSAHRREGDVFWQRSGGEEPEESSSNLQE